MEKVVELRIRSPRGGFRYQLGIATTREQVKTLTRQRDLLRQLHVRGDFDVLEAIKAGRATVEEVEALVDEVGMSNFRSRLTLLQPLPVTDLPTLADHAQAWLKTIRKEGTRGVYRKGIRYLVEFEVDGQPLGARPWPQVPRHTVRDAKAALPLASNTVRTVMASWSGFFTWAIEREMSEAEAAGREPLITSNPVRAAKAWDPIEITRHRFLTWEEFVRWLGVSPAPMRAQYATLILTGLRIEEFMVLPAAHVFLPTHVHVGPWGGWVPKGYPRVKHGVRDVPLHRMLIPMLEDYATTYAGTDRFFLNPTNGKEWSYGAFKERMQADIQAAGMVYGQLSRKDKVTTRKRDGITPHTCRHTLASWLAQDDVQLMKIAKILGDTEDTVRRHYAHLVPKDLDQAVNRVGSR